MSFETFKTCVDKLPEKVTVDFTGFYEPFLNQECTEMILYAAEIGLDVRLSTTIMGLTPDQIERLRHINFEKFAVHLPDTRGLTRIIVDSTYLASLLKLIESDISNIGFHVHEGIDGPEAVHQQVYAVLEAHSIVPENRWINTRAGNIDIGWKKEPERLTGELEMCPRIYQNVLLPTGDVALCCMDWDLKHIIGNLIETDYQALFTGSQFQEILRGYVDDSIDILCRSCEVARTKKQTLLRKFVADAEAERNRLANANKQVVS